MEEPNEELLKKMREGARPEDYVQQHDAPPPSEIFDPAPESASASASPPPRGAGTARQASFEPIPETASASPHTQGGGGRRNAMPEAVIRPKQPAASGQTASLPAPWLPPTLRTLLPRLVLPAALLAIPVAAAFALQVWLARTHVAYDGNLLLADGGADEVTALQWSPTDGALYIGTRSGSSRRVSANGTMEEILSPRAIDAADGDAVSPVGSFHSLQAQSPVVVYQDRLNPATDRPAGGFAATQTVAGLFAIDGGLFAAVDANNGSAVVGRPASADVGQQFGLPNNNVFNAANQVAPQQQVQQEQAQQQQIQPTGEQLKGEQPLPEPVPVDPTTSGPARFGLSLFRDLQSGSATEVGEIFGIEDVRAVAALPGTDTVIAGDGEGNVFAIDASAQISGASPETYIRGIGQHETAIVEIAVAAQPADDGVLFATRAEDRSVKIWRGSVSRTSQLIPLGDYPSTDVTTPGSTWVREQIEGQGGWASLLSMSADGSRIVGIDTDGRTRLIKDGQIETWDAGGSFGLPAVLSPDGSTLVALNKDQQTLDMITLPGLLGHDDFARASAISASFTGVPLPIAYLAFDRNSRRFVALSSDGSVSIRNIHALDEAITLGQYQNIGIEAAISPDGSLVAVAETSGRIMIHSAEDGSELTIIQGPQNLGQLAFDDSGKRLRASTTDTLRVYTYSLRNPRSATYDSGFLADAGREGFFPGGDRYFARNGDAGYRIIDIDSGAEVGTLQAATGATGWVSNLNGSRIATLGGRGNVSLFREEESPTANGPMPATADNALRLSADGRTLLVGGRNGELYLARLNGDAGEMGYRLRRLTMPAPALQYEVSPDGSSIVTSEADGTVSISDLAYVASTPAPPNSPRPPTGGGEPSSAGSVTVAETIEISGHGAPLTAMALSPDGGRLATASLDGRLRVTSLAWARFVHALPLSALPSGPERAKLEPQPLDESPYARMGGEPPTGNGGEQPFIVVYNARKSLGQALGARGRAAEAGFPGGLIYRRQGFFRGVFTFATAEARDEALPRIREVFSGAYARDLATWCPNAQPNEDFIDCAAVVAGAGAPAMAN